MAATGEKVKDLMVRQGKNIKAAREEAGYTQLQLAKLTRMGENHISAIETGVRAAGKKSITKLCDALMVDEQTLLFGRKPPVDLEGLTIEKRFLYEAIQDAEKNIDAMSDEHAEEAARLLRKLVRELQEA